MEKILGSNYYDRPFICSKCGGDLIFKGVGEYHCEKCNGVEYDDYGKVRLYLEKNKGANVMQIEEATGVSKKAINQMVKEERFEVTQNSKVLLYCERCHAPIRSGRLCSACEIQYNRELEAKKRAERKNGFEGVGMGPKGEKGEKRFQR